MTTTDAGAPAADLEEAMCHLVANLHRMPEHWADRRAEIHSRINDYLTEWEIAQLNSRITNDAKAKTRA